MDMKPGGSWLMHPDGSWTPDLNDPAMKALNDATPGGLKTDYRETPVVTPAAAEEVINHVEG